MSGFMQKQVTDSRKWIEIDGSEGSMLFDAELFTQQGAAENYPGKVWTNDIVRGFGARLSAPGYLDCADWSVYASIEDAEKALAEMFDDDDDATN